jgi:hypothetical protein
MKCNCNPCRCGTAEGKRRKADSRALLADEGVQHEN